MKAGNGAAVYVGNSQTVHNLIHSLIVDEHIDKRAIMAPD